MNIAFISAGVYLAVGVIFAFAFLSKGVTKIDPTAKDGATWGFRVLIFPGTVALWPLLARRWFAGNTEPPEEKNAHRCAACDGCTTKPSSSTS